MYYYVLRLRAGDLSAYETTAVSAFVPENVYRPRGLPHALTGMPNSAGKGKRCRRLVLRVGAR